VSAAAPAETTDIRKESDTHPTLFEGNQLLFSLHLKQPNLDFRKFRPKLRKQRGQNPL
jgi:hypothetical protein